MFEMIFSQPGNISFPRWKYLVPSVGIICQLGARLLSNKCRVLNGKGTLLKNNPRLLRNRWHLLQDLTKR